jgi:hypothetical protein
MVRRRRRAAAAVAGIGVAAGLVGVTACSGGSAGAEDRLPADPRSAVAQAADALVRAGTSRVRTTMVVTGDGAPRTITGSGAFDYGRQLGEVTVVLPPGAAEPGPVTEVFAPGALYMRNRGDGVPEDKWVRVDTTRLADGDLVTGGATDPLTAARLLAGVRSVAALGEERVQGARVRHYRGTTDLAAAASAAAPAVRGPLEAAARDFATTAVPFDAYLDDQGRLRQIREVFSYVAAGGRRMTVTATTTVYGFGASASIALPPAADSYPGLIVSPGG